MEPTWKEFAAKLSDRFLEPGNIAVGAIILGQFISAEGFRWSLTLLGLGLWVFLFHHELSLPSLVQAQRRCLTSWSPSTG